MHTFDDLCRDFRVTAKERVDLAHHLASIRYRRTVRVLLSDEAMAAAHHDDALKPLRR